MAPGDGDLWQLMQGRGCCYTDFKQITGLTRMEELRQALMASLKGRLRCVSFVRENVHFWKSPLLPAAAMPDQAEPAILDSKANDVKKKHHWRPVVKVTVATAALAAESSGTDCKSTLSTPLSSPACSASNNTKQQVEDSIRDEQLALMKCRKCYKSNSLQWRHIIETTAVCDTCHRLGIKVKRQLCGLQEAYDNLGSSSSTQRNATMVNMTSVLDKRETSDFARGAYAASGYRRIYQAIDPDAPSLEYDEPLEEPHDWRREIRLLTPSLF